MAAPSSSGASKLHGLGGGPEDDQTGFVAERKKIRAAFELFDRDRKRTVPKESVKAAHAHLLSASSFLV